MYHVSSLVRSLDSTCPGFAEYLNKSSEFKRPDGRISIHGVFLTLACFVEDSWQQLDNHTLEDLFEYVEVNFSTEQLDIGNAICTCFLEELKNAKCYARVLPFLGRKSKQYLDETPFA